MSKVLGTVTTAVGRGLLGALLLLVLLLPLRLLPLNAVALLKLANVVLGSLLPVAQQVVLHKQHKQQCELCW
jgi:hypothetical protein